MEGVNAFTIVYVGLATLFNVALLLNGETRVDAYVALNILSYYIAYGLFMRRTRGSLAQRIVNGFLLLVFLVIVAYSVWLVIGG